MIILRFYLEMSSFHSRLQLGTRKVPREVFHPLFSKWTLHNVIILQWLTEISITSYEDAQIYLTFSFLNSLGMTSLISLLSLNVCVQRRRKSPNHLLFLINHVAFDWYHLNSYFDHHHLGYLYVSRAFHLDPMRMQMKVSTKANC